VTEEDDVLVLNEKNFEETVKGRQHILVEFYAPWCGHCKQFAPEYAAAAKQLKAATPPIALAKVDATKETKIADEYGVRGYPTIRLFTEGKDQEYTGGRTAQHIVTWVLKKAGAAADQLDNVTMAEKFEKENPLAVIGLFQPSANLVAFKDAAAQVEDVMFAYTTSLDVIARYDGGTPAPGVRMLFPHDEKFATFSGDLDSSAQIMDFVKKYKHPIVSTFSGETAAEIFADGRPILFMFRNDEGDSAEEQVRVAAPQLERRMLVSVVGSSEPMDQRLMDYVGVEPEELPTAFIVASPTSNMVKYKLSGDLSSSSILQFAADYESGRLKPHLKSDPVPDSQPGPVYVLVGSTFDAVVKDSSKDVLVEFYAPWCGHCKKLEPVYREVAKKLQNVKTLVIAKIDATSNNVQGVDVEGFPTIKFWRANKKDEPLDYDGDRDVDSFITWLEEKAALPFVRDEGRNEL
jgi:protein disulfide-isomerase A1